MNGGQLLLFHCLWLKKNRLYESYNIHYSFFNRLELKLTLTRNISLQIVVLVSSATNAERESISHILQWHICVFNDTGH